MQVEQDIPASALVRVYLLGPLELWKKDPSGTWKLIPKEKWKNSKPARLIFKRLLVQPGRRLARGTIEDDLWSDSDNFELATRNVYNTISLIRGIIGKPLVIYWEAAYEIAAQSLVWTDLDACSALLTEAENRRGSIQSIPLLEQAVSLLERGELLEGEDGQWCYAFRKRAEDLFRQARLWLAESYEAQGKRWQAGEQYRALILTNPSDEDALLYWLEMLVRHGKRQEALKCYRDMKAFVEAQGFTLSREIEQAITQIKQQSSPESSSFLPPGQKSRNTLHSSLNLPAWADTGAIPAVSISAIMPFEHFTVLEEPLRICQKTLYLFSTLTETCRHLSEGNELRVAEQVLWMYLPKIEAFTRFPSDYQKRAANSASQSYLLAASLVGHRNDLLRRLCYSQQALHYGKMADDLNLQGVAMRQIAISFDCLDRPDKVLEVSQQILPYLKNTSPLLQACVYAGIAGAYAELGQEHEAQHFMERAYKHFPEHPEGEPGYLHTICRYSTLVFFDGLNQLDLGHPHEAEKILARIDGLQPKMPLPERVRIELLNYQVKVFLALRKREQASAYLEEAVKASFSIGSERHFQETFALYRQMQNMWKHEPQVQQLADLFIR